MHSSRPVFINKLYFWYSLTFIACRTITLVLFASKIQENARYPIQIFRTIPTEGWNEELQRFFDQIKTTSNALSGLEFFLLTRKLLFGLIGTLITYELVLLQFKSEDTGWDFLENCEEPFKL